MKSEKWVFNLIGEIRQYFATWHADGSDGATFLPVLLAELDDLGADNCPSSNLPPVVVKWLPEVVQMPTMADAAPLLHAVGEYGRFLKWVPSPPDYVSPQFAKGFAYTQLVGNPVRNIESPPFKSSKIGLGFSLQAPHQFYPPHYHEPIEYYGVLAGNGRWQHGNSPPTMQPTGTRIFHAANVNHAMQTIDHPMLTVWAWIGNINAFPTMSSNDWLGTDTNSPRDT